MYTGAVIGFADTLHLTPECLEVYLDVPCTRLIDYDDIAVWIIRIFELAYTLTLPVIS
jgi:hypothetical protein